MPNCPCCAARAESGSLIRNWRCIECCADEIRSHRPNRKLQETALRQLECLQGAPARGEILERLRNELLAD